MTGVAVTGAGVISAHGLGWRHLATVAAPPSYELTIPSDRDIADVKARRLMSRSAQLAAIAAREALREAGWSDRTDVGYWLGVGASGGPLDELVTVLGIARDGDAISMARLGNEGLAASNPLHTFQVLNNFTMCHGAILEGTRGPNSALFSRGAGTVHALAEAVFAIEDGDCTRALAGGADTATHPVTRAELARDGFASRGLVASEGAAVLALARASEVPSPLAVIDHVRVGEPGNAEVVVIAPWGEPARDRLRTIASRARVIDASIVVGEALAATPALAWSIALAQLAGGAERVCVLSLGIDDELASVGLRRAR